MKLSRTVQTSQTHTTLNGLLGQHPRIKNRQLTVRLDRFLGRLQQYRDEHVPAYQAYRDLRQHIIQRERSQLRLEELKPRPLSSFVRNQLINDVYFPLIGDNFAKQMGAAGKDKRTDLMGLLLLISPPGYGKTTLMEYLAQRLGLVFVKINCPTLGHSVTAIDPEEAPNATARQELEKLNLALEMGSNVMLYLDDIQHSNPEFLQKFISMADGQRRIEGVWKGRPRTYDLRGKRFCLAMAGNPYTESGEMFKIPDMLANRADIYNLGDVLSGSEAVFAQSYIENTLTSNAILAPLANRDQQDVYRFIKLAQGQEVASGEFSHQYSGAESQEIIQILRKLLTVQSVLLKVNQQYILSAGQAENYRTEPAFKLQGSYRNMNKLAEKIVAVMNDSELEALIDDHYQGEAQTLTTGAEENLLKLAELRGVLNTEQTTRWQDIKAEFNRQRSLGGEDDGVGLRMLNQISTIGVHLDKIQRTIATNLKHTATSSKPVSDTSIAPSLVQLNQHLVDIHTALAKQTAPQITIKAQYPQSLETTVEKLVLMIDDTLLPVVHSFERKSRMDLVLWNRLKEVSDTLKDVQKQVKK